MNRAMEVKFGRFLSNEKVTAEEIVRYAVEKTNELSSGLHTLVLQDTTEINHQAHKERATGLGTVGNGKDVGFFLHPAVVLDAGSGACLGLGAEYHWIRTKRKQKNYQKQPIEEKESYRWLDTAEAVKKNLSQAKSLTIIADRESDIYEEWCRIPDEKTHLLTRACRDRKLSNGNTLFNYVSDLEVKGCYEIAVRERPGKRSMHEAKLELRFSKLEIKRPQSCSDVNAPQTIHLQVVDVREKAESVVGTEAPIHWCLLTTHEVKTIGQALQVVRWYSQRWHIEQIFRTLKLQGFGVENSQLETKEGLVKLTLLALGAIQTYQLLMARDGKDSGRGANDIFDSEELEVLSVLLDGLEGKTEKQKNPHKKNSLAWAAWIIARLGGWKGYASERPPGPITMLHGQKEFSSIYRGWKLTKNVCIP